MTQERHEVTQVTVFKDIKSTNTPFYASIEQVFERIKEGKSKDLVKKIREEKEKSARQELKKNLPSICFSGKFTKRADNAIVEHSGLICLDFDGYERQRDMIEEKERLSKDKYVHAVFISPSGNGLKVLVKIPKDVENHTLYFNALQKHFDTPRFDTTSKNISRVCYESYDPLLHVNPISSIWETFSEPEYKEVTKKIDAPTIAVTDENKIVEILLKWWQKNYPMVEGQRNHNVYVLAMALNDFGINRNLAEYILNQYESSDFKLSEIKQTVESAYSKTENFGTKYYEDEERITNIKLKLKRGASEHEIRAQLQSEMDDETIDAVLEKIEAENAQPTFWTKNDKGQVKIIHILFKQFLEDNGFYKYCPEGGKSYVFVRVTNNLVDHTSEKEIKDFTLNYLLDIEDVSVYNYFADQTRFFREDFLSLLSTIDIYFVADSKDAAYLYYRNCAVKVTAENVTSIDYIDLGGYVWKDHVIDRNYTECEVTDACDFRTFVGNICGNDKGRIDSMHSTIGFMLHAYKNMSFCPAVILNDEVISDNPEGGTGKGLLMNGIGQMKKVVTIDGKSFTFEKSFAYQLVSADTQILVFDDVRKHFDFERLFSVVTEGLTLEKKNKDAIKIPFHKSPKISITTNYAIKGVGNSFARRKWELELHQYYSKDFTPLDEFGKLMFGDWDDDDWCQFDNYMIQCLQGYLDTGLIKSKFVNLKIRQLSAETCHEFIEWCGLVNSNETSKLLEPKGQVYKQDMYMEFVSEYPDYGPKAKMTVSRTKFYRWVVAYCLYKYGVEPEQGRDAHGRWIRIRSKHELEKQSELKLNNSNDKRRGGKRGGTSD